MSRKSSIILSGLAFAALSIAASSCSDDARFIGTWTEAAPVTVTAVNPSASALTSQLTVDFTENASKDGGDVIFTCVLDGVRKVSAEAVAAEPVAESKVSATATIKGSWTYDVDNHDDLLLSFDRSSISFDIASDPALTPDAAELWKREVNQVVTSSLSQYTTIEDVRVSKDGKTLTFETENPDRDHHFRRAGM